MVTLQMLWLPILLSAVFVFVVSSLIHMFLPWHKNDYRKVPDEDKLMDILRPLNIPPGDYMVPRAASTAEMRSPAFLDKMKKGPVMMLSVWQSGTTGMSKELILWFLYTVVIGIFAGYVSGRALQVGSPYLSVFRFAGTTAFLGYTAALWQMSIWYRRPWSTTLVITLDGLIYALLTAGTFGWLWPH
jgi:hypothetical protein